MNFLFVCKSDGVLGGIETQIVRMSHWLVAHGHAVTVLTVSDRHWGKMLPPGVRCIALGTQFWVLHNYFPARRMWRELHIPRPDVVKSFNWEFNTDWIGYQLAIITRAKVVSAYYGTSQQLRDYPYDFYLRNFLRGTSPRGRIFLAPEHIDELEKMYGQGGEKWLLPVDSGHFLPATRQPIWGNIISIGRLSDIKGYNFYMIDVVDELVRRGLKVTWTAHGTGEYETEMRELIQARELGDVITLAGPMPYEKCRQQLAQAYVFVGMGTSVVEASLFGVPNVVALAYDRTGMTYGPLYRLRHGSIGDVLPCPPTLTVVDEIERILKLSPLEYEHEAERVRQYAEPFEAELSMQRFIQIAEAAPRPQRRFWPCIENYLIVIRYRLALFWKKWAVRLAQPASLAGRKRA